MKESNDWDISEDLSEGFSVNENDKIVEGSYERSKNREQDITKKSFSKKLIFAFLIIVVGFIGIYSWSFVFEYLGLTPFSQENKENETTSKVNVILQSKPEMPQNPEAQIKGSENINATLSLEIKTPPTPELFKTGSNASVDIKIPEYSKPEDKAEEVGQTEIKIPNEPGIDMKTPTSGSETLEKSKNKEKKMGTQAFIFSKPKNHYTIQILGLQDLEKTKAFIKKNPMKNKLNFYQTKHQEKPWFVVIYGDFSSMQAAKEAQEKLPFPLKKHKPWVRQFQDIQENIRANSSTH